MRLTSYDDENRYYRPCDYESDKQSTILKLCKKLGQLEDIEEELKIDFSMLDKICQNGVYCYKRSITSFSPTDKKLGDIIHIENSDIKIEFFGVYKEERMGVSIMGCINYMYHTLPIEQYGKTWALTKEELN